MLRQTQPATAEELMTGAICSWDGPEVLRRETQGLAFPGLDGIGMARTKLPSACVFDEARHLREAQQTTGS